MRSRHKVLTAGTTVGAGLALFLGSGGNAVAAPLSVSWDYPQGALSAGGPNVGPPGSIYVDWRDGIVPAACHSAVHPVPVLLIPGTTETASTNWQAMSPWLANNGYCVYSLTYGNSSATGTDAAMAHIWVSAQQLGTAVNLVLQATGAPQLDFVGHSQGGGLTPAWYIDFLMRNNNQPLGGNAQQPLAATSGPSKVRNFIGISPSNHGTTLDGIASLGNLLGVTKLVVGNNALSDQVAGSAVNNWLAAFGDTAPGVKYTTIIEKGDEVVTPYTVQALRTSTAHPLAAGASINNIVLQSPFTVNWTNDVTKKTTPESEGGCLLDGGEHIANAYNSRTGRIVTDTLGGTSNGGYLDPYCHVIIPLVGG